MQLTASVRDQNGRAMTGVAVTWSSSDAEVVTVDGNELTGDISATLGGLAALQELTLSDNGLTGPIPSELGNLKNPTTLWLFGNGLSGSLPPPSSATSAR